MNNKVKELNLSGTHFSNTHGFHDENHYTTAYDMSQILAYCLKNEIFRKYIETKFITIPETNVYETRYLTNGNSLIIENSQYYNEYVLGGKKGWTGAANGTFVGYGKKDDKEVYFVLLNNVYSFNGLETKYIDATNILDYVFSNTDIFSINDNNINVMFIDDKKNISYTLKNYSAISFLTTTNTKNIYSINSISIDFDMLFEDTKNQNQSNTSKLNLQINNIKNENTILLKIENFIKITNYKNYLWTFILILFCIIVIIINDFRIKYKKLSRKKHIKYKKI